MEDEFSLLVIEPFRSKDSNRMEGAIVFYFSSRQEIRRSGCWFRRKRNEVVRAVISPHDRETCRAGSKKPCDIVDRRRRALLSIQSPWPIRKG